VTNSHLLWGRPQGTRQPCRLQTAEWLARDSIVGTTRISSSFSVCECRRNETVHLVVQTAPAQWWTR